MTCVLTEILPSEVFTALRFGIDDVCNLDQRPGLAQDFVRDRVSRHCGSVRSRISTGTNSIPAVLVSLLLGLPWDAAGLGSQKKAA